MTLDLDVHACFLTSFGYIISGYVHKMTIRQSAKATINNKTNKQNPRAARGTNNVNVS